MSGCGRSVQWRGLERAGMRLRGVLEAIVESLDCIAVMGNTGGFSSER